jgi:hypothetical protein
MRKIFIVSALFSMGSLFAEMMGPVEYQLPEVAQTWERDSDVDENMQIVGFTSADTGEAFVATFSSGEMPDGVLEAVEASFKKRPDTTISRLEKDGDSMLCEYTTSYQGETLYVLIRLFLAPEGLVTLTHAAPENRGDDLWLNVLQSATVIGQ